MRYKAIIVFCIFLILSSHAIAKDLKQSKVSKKYQVTSVALQKKYQKANAALLFTLANPGIYAGPTTGPGYYTGYNGPLVKIEWLMKIKGKMESSARRYVPFSSLLSVDLPMMQIKSAKNCYVVYYKGPFGDTEYFILVDQKMDNGKQLFDQFLKRWNLYLLAQESEK